MAARAAPLLLNHACSHVVVTLTVLGRVRWLELEEVRAVSTIVLRGALGLSLVISVLSVTTAGRSSLGERSTGVPSIVLDELVLGDSDVADDGRLASELVEGAVLGACGASTHVASRGGAVAAQLDRQHLVGQEGVRLLDATQLGLERLLLAGVLSGHLHYLARGVVLLGGRVVRHLLLDHEVGLLLGTAPILLVQHHHYLVLVLMLYRVRLLSIFVVI